MPSGVARSPTSLLSPLLEPTVQGKLLMIREAIRLRANKMEHLGILLAKEKIVLRFHMDDGSGNHSLRPLSLLSFSGPFLS